MDHHAGLIRMENFPLTATVLFDIRTLASPSNQSVRIRLQTKVNNGFYSHIYSAYEHNTLSYTLQKADQFIDMMTYSEQRRDMQYIIKYSGGYLTQ